MEKFVLMLFDLSRYLRLEAQRFFHTACLPSMIIKLRAGGLCDSLQPTLPFLASRGPAKFRLSPARASLDRTSSALISTFYSFVLHSLQHLLQSPLKARNDVVYKLDTQHPRKQHQWGQEYKKTVITGPFSLFCTSYLVHCWRYRGSYRPQHAKAVLSFKGQ